MDLLIGQPNLRALLSADPQSLCHMILHGPPGVGKTFSVALFCKRVKTNFCHINASDERGIGTVRTRIVNFAKREPPADCVNVIVRRGER